MTMAKEVVREFLLQVRSGKHPERAGKYMATQVEAHQVQAEAPATVVRTPQQYTAHVREMLAVYGPFEFSIDELLSEDDRVYARWHQVGRHQGALDGHAPTGRPLTQYTSAVYRVRDEVIVEYWIQIDRQGVLAQLQAS
ncbi:ester cyclase [Streptomyces tropicalis]|uniref:Ester cyclase n=1 Tax=Streptomyces tropicalis TaxID=3034234 RepID=A0ABT6A461_9ACTN|nr:ester cyclase [Streptomyces tropicalis]MDF3299443.1 ester cyclase [Streptomyces tropicalis]